MRKALKEDSFFIFPSYLFLFSHISSISFIFLYYFFIFPRNSFIFFHIFFIFPAFQRGGAITRTRTEFLRWSIVPKGKAGLPPKTLQFFGGKFEGTACTKIISPSKLFSESINLETLQVRNFPAIKNSRVIKYLGVLVDSDLVRRRLKIARNQMKACMIFAPTKPKDQVWSHNLWKKTGRSPKLQRSGEDPVL